ncbi:MAG: hypothetical protein KF718_20180 [Polyangiaceae bacterium]|nr:hypothetical protein [Polyangiaceae bacterium]
MVGRGALLGLALLGLTSLATAAPKPPTPSFPAACDPFASYAAQSTCDPTAKPGAVSFRDFILKTYPSTSNLGITRACSSGGTSEHKEGRAWDWGVNYYNAAQRDIADTVIGWLLETDNHGNACALARRTGMMYFIWNKQIWASYRAPNSTCATAGWKAYTGSNPHTDHVHFSWAWAGAKAQTSWWTSALPVVTNEKPAGYLDGADCTRVWGWSRDPDAPKSSIDVHLYFGGPAGNASAEGVVVKANQSRDDLCSALGSCPHGFEVASPLSLHDGQPHAVHAYGIDSAGGPNAQLQQSPATMQCAPVVPTGVKRHVTDPTSFDAWGFSHFWDVMPIGDQALGSIAQGGDVPPAPLLVRADDDNPSVWLIDAEVKRHVPSAAVFDTWGFEWSSIVTWSAADVAAFPVGPPLRERPVLVRGTGPAVYLMDDDVGMPSPGGPTGWGSGGTGGASSSGGNPGQSTRVLPEENGGCACGAAGRAPRSPLWVGLVGLGACLLVRRRRPAR